MESKYRNEKKFPFLDFEMAIELMSTALPFAFSFRFVSLSTRCFVVLRSLLANFQVTLVVMDRIIREIGKYLILSAMFEYFQIFFWYLENTN